MLFHWLNFARDEKAKLLSFIFSDRKDMPLLSTEEGGVLQKANTILI